MKIKVLIFLFVSITLLVKAQATGPKVNISEFPKKDLPPSGFKRKGLKVKESYKYYYGIGVPVDYVMARYLAFREMRDSIENTFGAGAILIMLYANGFGVTRNIDLSEKLALGNIWAAPAEQGYRQKHLEKIRSGEDTSVFDICNDITSGLMSGLCAWLGFEMVQARRDRTLDSVIHTWPRQDSLAYVKLRHVANNFFQARSSDEVDLSGTAREAFEEEEQDSLEQNFLDKILKANTCNFPKYSPDEFSKADRELNSVYSKVMQWKDTLDWGTVTKEQIKGVEEKWIHYRDAWVAFGLIRCPELSGDSWKALFTKERISQLKDFLFVPGEGNH